MTPIALEPMSEDAILVRFGARIDAAINAEVHAAAAAIDRAGLAGITDVAPAYASLLVRFDPRAWTLRPDDSALARISAALRGVFAMTDSADRRRAPDALSRPAIEPRAIDIPVCYGGACGPDLADVAAHAGIRAEDVVARHVARTYTVAMLGFAPGFPYLLGLDPALRTPRRSDPRTRVPRGAVAIGGAQTGIYPRALPGGWQLIGRTPLELFTPRRDPPALLGPGDRVRFRAIDEATFERIRVDATDRTTTAAGGSG